VRAVAPDDPRVGRTALCACTVPAMAITDWRDARVERTVAKVLDAVHRLLRTEGLGSVTFGRVSKETWVSRTTLYRHWSGPF
jgi:AcrR family transcriptional regulator